MPRISISPLCFLSSEPHLGHAEPKTRLGFISPNFGGVKENGRKFLSSSSHRTTCPMTLAAGKPTSQFGCGGYANNCNTIRIRPSNVHVARAVCNFTVEIRHISCDLSQRGGCDIGCRGPESCRKAAVKELSAENGRCIQTRQSNNACGSLATLISRCF